MWKWSGVWIFSLLVSLNSPLAIAAEQNQSPPSTRTLNSHGGKGAIRDCESNLLKTRYTFLPEARPELYGARSGAAAMSRRGDFFAGLQQAARTGVYNFNEEKFTTFEDGSLEQVSDL